MAFDLNDPKFAATMQSYFAENPDVFQSSMAQAQAPTGLTGMDLMGTSLQGGSQQGLQANDTGFTGYINPHGGSTFLGIRDDGQKQVIDQDMAMRLGYVPHDRLSWGEGPNDPSTLTSGADQVAARNLQPLGAPAPQESGGLLNWINASPENAAQFGGQLAQQQYQTPEYAAALGDNPAFGQALVDQGLIYQDSDSAWNDLQEYQDAFRENRTSGGDTDLTQYTDKLGTLNTANQLTQHLEGLRETGMGTEDIQTWFNGINTLFANNPEDFGKWQAENPEMAIRFHEKASRSDTGWDADRHENMATQLGWQLAQAAGAGDDGKIDGKAIATNYSDFNDVNSEDGPGDFWKLGQLNSMDGGLNDFVEDNPWQTAAIVASLAAAGPLAGALTPALGATGAAAATGGGLSALTTAAGGGDLGDVLKSGLWGAGTAGLGQYAQGLTGSFVPPQGTDVINNFNGLTDFGLNAATEGAKLPSIGGAASAIGELNAAINDDRPSIGNTPVSDPEGGRWVRDDDPESVSGWKVEPNDPNDAGGGGESASSSSGANSNPGGQPAPNDNVGANTSKGEHVEMWRHTNADGSVVAGNDVGDIWEVEAAPEDTSSGANWGLLGGVLGGGLAGIGGSNTSGSSASTGSTGPSGGGQTGTAPTGTQPSGNEVGLGGSGTGGGQGTGDGTGNGPGSGEGDYGPDYSTDYPEVPVAGGSEEWNGDYRRPARYGQVRYEKPDFGPAPAQRPFPTGGPQPTQAGQRPFPTGGPQGPSGGMPRGYQPPMVLPASNSGQAKYEEWLIQYLKQLEAQQGLLGSTGSAGGLI